MRSEEMSHLPLQEDGTPYKANICRKTIQTGTEPLDNQNINYVGCYLGNIRPMPTWHEILEKLIILYE